MRVSGSSVSLAVDSEEGVTLGMRFIMVNSDDKYLDDLEITEVSPHACTGTLEFFSSKVHIGDLAISELNFRLPSWEKR